MNVDFENKKVKELFDDLNDVKNSKRLMQKKIGDELTRSVKKRFNEIVAFTSFFELVNSKIGKIESLTGNFEGCYSMTVSKNYRLILKPVAENCDVESLKKCDELVIKGVVDYHGQGTGKNWIIP